MHLVAINHYCLSFYIMKEFTIWDGLLLLEFGVYFVFMLLVALEFCSTSFAVYFILITVILIFIEIPVWEVRWERRSTCLFLLDLFSECFRKFTFMRIIFSILMHVFMVLPDYCREFITVMLEESTNLIFITGFVIIMCLKGSLSLQVVFLVQIYYALLGLSQPAIRKVFIFVIMAVLRFQKSNM